MANYRLFPSTSGPAAGTAYTGPYLAGVVCRVTADNLWLPGYWWWVCNSGQQTSAVKFALWQVDNTTAGIVIPAATVTSGALAAGQWNYVPIATPIALSKGVPYVASCGFACSPGFPDTGGQFGAGQTYASGITNGPLRAYSDIGASDPSPNNWFSQGSFGTASADPAAQIPNGGSSGSSNFWMDLQVTDVAPAGASYRLWPSLPDPPGGITDQALNFTLGTEFTLSQACTLNKIWFYSLPGTTQLPTVCGIFNIGTQTVLAGTQNNSPSWSGAAGSGWVSCSYSGITLPAATKLKVAVCNGAGGPVAWDRATLHYWDTGTGANGITAGPLSAPNEANASAPGQSSYHSGAAFSWPDSYSGSAAAYWVDVEVTPAAPGPVPPLISQRSGLY